MPTSPTRQPWVVLIRWQFLGEKPGIRYKGYRVEAYTEEGARQIGAAHFNDERDALNRKHAQIDRIEVNPARTEQPKKVLASYPIGPDGEMGHLYSDGTTREEC